MNITIEHLINAVRQIPYGTKSRIYVVVIDVKDTENKVITEQVNFRRKEIVTNGITEVWWSCFGNAIQIKQY